MPSISYSDVLPEMDIGCDEDETLCSGQAGCFDCFHNYANCMFTDMLYGYVQTLVFVLYYLSFSFLYVGLSLL